MFWTIPDNISWDESKLSLSKSKWYSLDKDIIIHRHDKIKNISQKSHLKLIWLLSEVLMISNFKSLKWLLQLFFYSSTELSELYANLKMIREIKLPFWSSIQREAMHAVFEFKSILNYEGNDPWFLLYFHLFRL